MQDTQPLVSIIVPIYNKEKYVERTLRSISEQTLKNIEIIAVNDGSTDTSSEIMHEYAKHESRMKCFDQENAGLSVSRNNCIKKATGKYILFVDSDDAIKPDAAEELSRIAEHDDLDVLYFDAQTINDTGNAVSERMFTQYIRKNDYTTPRKGNELMIDMLKADEYIPSACLQLCKRKYLLDNGIFFMPGILHEDNLFTFINTLSANRAAHIGKPFYVRYLVPDSIVTVKPTSAHLKGYVKVYEGMLAFIKNKEFDITTQWAIRQITGRIWSSIYNTFNRLDDKQLFKLLSAEDFSDRVLYSSMFTRWIRVNNGDIIAEMDDGIAVSVIIPVNNTDVYLYNCLDSVLNQSLENIEVICVDTGSTDMSRQILDEYAAEDSRVRVITQSGQSSSVIRHNCIESAQGEYIVFINSSDFVDKDYLLDSYQIAIRYQCDVVLNSMDRYDNKTHMFTEHPLSLHQQTLPKANTFSAEDIPNQILNAATDESICKLLRKKFIIDNGFRFSDINGFEDMQFTIPMLLSAKAISICSCNTPYYHYRINHDDNIEISKQHNSMLFIDACKSLYDEIQERGLTQKYSITLKNYILNTLYREISYTKSYETYKALQEYFIVKGRKYFEFDGTGINWINDEESIRHYDEIFNNPITKTKFTASIPISMADNFGKHDAVTEPIVSIVLPTYNVEKYINDCLVSLENQTESNIEIIFVDDKSTDRTCEIIERYAKTDKRIKLLHHETNLYAGIARNTGMAEAKGKYIIFLDPDDFYTANIISKPVACLEKTGADICVFGAKAYDNVTHKYSNLDHLYKQNRFPKTCEFTPEENAAYIFNFATPCPWNKLYRRSFVEKTGLKFQGATNSNDMFFVLSSFACASKITVLKEYLLYYRKNVATSLQFTKAKDPLAFYHEMIKVCVEMEKRGYTNRFKQSLDNSVADNIAFNLRTLAKDEQVYEKVFKLLQTEGLTKLGISIDDPGYYYDMSSCKAVITLLHKSYEEHVSTDKPFEKAQQAEPLPNCLRPMRIQQLPWMVQSKASQAEIAEAEKRGYKKGYDIGEKKGMVKGTEKGVIITQKTPTFKIGKVLMFIPHTIKRLVKR